MILDQGTLPIQILNVMALDSINGHTATNNFRRTTFDFPVDAACAVIISNDSRNTSMSVAGSVSLERNHIIQGHRD